MTTPINALGLPVTEGPMTSTLRSFGRRIHEYFLLMRLDRPIGIWLLLWPTLWALWIAGAGRPKPGVFTIFVLGTLIMRSAGCVTNDIADRNIDPYVRRTRDRPLAARRVSPYDALLLAIVLGAFALWLASRLDPLTIRLALIGALLAISYPFLKRFFPLPQLYLGVAFGWGIPMAFAAQFDRVPRVAWVLLCANVLWTAVYDTLYAMVDREDDFKLGVKSSAILFADMDKFAIGAMQLMVLFAFVLAGRSLEFGYWYYLGVAAAAIFFIYQQWLIRRREPEACLRAFLNNNYVGMALFVGIALEYTFRHG